MKTDWESGKSPRKEKYTTGDVSYSQRPDLPAKHTNSFLHLPVKRTACGANQFGLDPLLDLPAPHLHDSQAQNTDGRHIYRGRFPC